MRFRWVSTVTHIRWQIAVLFVGVVCGVWAAQFEWTKLFSGLPWLLVAVVIGFIGFWKRYKWLLAAVFVSGCLLGIIRGSTVQAELAEYNKLYGRVVALEGTVSDDTDVNKRGETVVRLKDIVYGDKEIGGMVWVTFDNKLSIERSDRIIVKGKIDHGFGTFAASMYNAELVKASREVPGDAALHMRNWFADKVRQAIPEPEASLGIGFLVGQRRALPDDLATALKTAGLMHIVVASGYNLTILVRLARRSLEKISKYLATVAAAGLIMGFIAITGMSPSMSRAGLVAGLSLAAWYYGRTIHPIILLALAAGITVAINPSYVWGDIGWLLSFSSFAGVMICAPLLQAYYFGAKKPGLLRQIIGETVAAWLFTLPVLLLVYGSMSNVAVLANLLIVPLIPLTMFFTFVAGLAAWLLPFIAPLVAFPAQVALSYMTQTAEWVAGLDWATREIRIEWWQAATMYVGLGVFCAYMYYRTKFSLSQSSLVE